MLPYPVKGCAADTDAGRSANGLEGGPGCLLWKRGMLVRGWSSAEQPIETSIREVRVRSVLVVIVGHAYGSVLPEDHSNPSMSFALTNFRK